MIASLKIAPVTDFDLPVDGAPSCLSRLGDLSIARRRSWAKRGKSQVVFNGPPPENSERPKTHFAREQRAESTPLILSGD